MPKMPAGMVTFLFADVEGSTRRLEQGGAETGRVLAATLEILRATVDGHAGVVFETVGDAAYAAFSRASDALAAAAEVHRALAAHDWDGGEAVRVRVAVHTGEVESRGRHYFGPPLFRCARLQALAWGGQTLLSGVTAQMIGRALPDGTTLRDHGVHVLKDLDEPEHVHELVVQPATTFPPLRTTDSTPTNLPGQLPSLIGREAEVAKLEALITAGRLVTITGPAGTGKTRLALEVASRLRGDRPDGVWFVDLAPVREPELVPAAIATTLGVREQPPAPIVDTTVDYLRPRRSLIVVDNFEQVADAAPTIGRLLAAPDVQIIATSREALRLRDEHEMPLSPLSARRPAADASVDELAASASVRLFVERAREAVPSFELTPANAQSVAQICARLDGLPLAIELAAPLLRVLTPDQLLERVTKRLDLLAARRRDLPERQRTLRAALTWSIDLLPDAPARAFAGLSVFADGFTIEAAEAVLADLDEDVVGLIGTLLDKSLLIRAFDVGMDARFRMLETVREFALERLDASGDRDVRRAALVAWAKDVVTRDGNPIRWFDALSTLGQFETERENVIAAMRWLAESGRETELVELVGATSSFWLAGGMLTEARPWLRRAVDVNGAPSRWSARLLRNAGAIEHELGSTARGTELVRESVAQWKLLGDDAERADALRRLGAGLYDRGELAEARRTLSEAVSTARSANDDQTRRAALADLAGIEIEEGNVAAAESLLAELLDACRRAGDQFGIGMAHGNRSYVFFLMGDLERAEAEGRAALDVFTQLRKDDVLGWVLTNLAEVLAETGRLEEASELVRRGLRLTRAHGSVRDLAAGLDASAVIALKLGDARRALRLATAAQRARADSELDRSGVEGRSTERHIVAARDLLGADAQRVEAEAAAEAIETIVGEELEASS